MVFLIAGTLLVEAGFIGNADEIIFNKLVEFIAIIYNWHI